MEPQGGRHGAPADEPGEFLAYWTTRYGRKIPKPVKRGISDAVRRLYTERALLKYDTSSHAYRFADVLELAHPEASSPWQSDLFKHAIDRRHGRGDDVPAALATVAANAALRASDDVLRWLDPQVLREAGMTWEDALSAMGSKVSKARLWEAMIPSMGVMALIRNLRNFDEAGVPDAAAAAVCVRLADPDEIARSRQFPFRFLSAYRAAPSLRWGHALDQALRLSTANIPMLPGRTLVVCDTSGSMERPVSAKSQIRHVDVAALFAVALAARGAKVDLVGFADGVFGQPLQSGGSVLKQTEAFCRRIGEVGHGTPDGPGPPGHLRRARPGDGLLGHAGVRQPRRRAGLGVRRGPGAHPAVRFQHHRLRPDVDRHVPAEPVRGRRVQRQAVHDGGPALPRPRRRVALGGVARYDGAPAALAAGALLRPR